MTARWKVPPPSAICAQDLQAMNFSCNYADLIPANDTNTQIVSDSMKYTISSLKEGKRDTDLCKTSAMPDTMVGILSAMDKLQG